MEDEGHQVAKENLEVIKVNPGECISERIVEQTVEPAESVDEAQPSGIAEHSVSTEPDLAVSLGEDGYSGLRKSVGEARPLEIAKHSDAAAVTTVAMSVGVGEARPPEVAMCRATTAATVANPDDVGQVRPSGIAKHEATTDPELAEFDEDRPPGFAKYRATTAATATTRADVTAVAQYAGEAQPPRIAKHSARTESELAESYGGEHMARPTPKLQQPQSLLVKIGLLRSQSAVPRKVLCRDQCPRTRSLSC